MRIARDGTWYYRGSPIGRLPLVKLFASVLRREDDGSYWLVTPAERGRVEVEDAPFLAVAVDGEGAGPRPAAHLPHQSGRDCDGRARAPAARRDRRGRRAGALCPGAAGARGAAAAPGVLRAGRSRRPRSRSTARCASGYGAAACSFALGDPGEDDAYAARSRITASDSRAPSVNARSGHRAAARGRSRPARLWRQRRPGRGGGVPPGAARRPRPQSRHDPAEHRAAAGGGAGAADRPRRGHVGAADPAHRASDARMPGRSRFPAAASRRTTRTRSPPRCARPRRRSGCRATGSSVDRPARHLRDRHRVRDHPGGRHRRAAFPLSIDPFEVAEAFEVPLVLHPRPAQPPARRARDRGGARRAFFVLPYRGPQHLGRHRRHPGQSGRGAGGVSEAMLRVFPDDRLAAAAADRALSAVAAGRAAAAARRGDAAGRRCRGCGWPAPACCCWRWCCSS